MKLSGRRIVISGGSKGLGKALAQRFAREGAKLALCARDGDRLEAVANELQEIGTEVVWNVCDIGNPKQVKSFASLALKKFGVVDVLVNNASTAVPLKDIAEYSTEEWEEVIRVNINGLFYLTHAFLPSMIERKSGTIINVSSTVGRSTRAKWGAYSVAKYAMEGFTQILTTELRPYNISINSVNPGALATDMRRLVHPEEDQNQLRKPEMATDLFVYLASTDGIGISGQQFDASTYVPPPKEQL